MFKKILIANRGEIACRVAQTAKRLGIQTVGVYSEADKHAKHVQVMDEAYLIGPPQPQQSYLRAERIIEVAHKTKAQAVHPGYGFLSENAKFVDQLEKDNITFIGPPTKAIRSMGSKAESKNIMSKANVPIVPGYHGDNQDPDFLLAESKKIGFPVMVKASLGGGGKGMRIVLNEGEFKDQLDAAKREAMKGFNDDHCIIEKYIGKPRHIEVQVFGDKHGNYVYLNERDCSVQRRHQKVIEEAPSQISPQIRKSIGEAAVQAARAVGYFNAGTVEFIFDTETDQFYFMEMNTRLQVEHPVTEMVTGLDLVEWQLKIAGGFHLPIVEQSKIPLIGHALEARVYAEDPENGFLPGSGLIKILREPKRQEGKVRIDTGIREGDQISTFYDPMISKLIVWGETRQEAIDRLYQSLEDYKVIGLPTNIKFMKRVLLNSTFKTGVFDTSFIAQNEKELLGDRPLTDLEKNKQLASVALVNVWFENETNRFQRLSHVDPWKSYDNFRVNNVARRDLKLTEGEGKEHHLKIEYLTENKFNVLNDKDEYILKNAEVILNQEREEEILIRTDSEQFRVPYLRDNLGELKKKEILESELGEGDIAKADFVKSPMPGTVVKIYCKIGQEVKKNEPLISVESMKMEFLIKATHDVKVKEIRTQEAKFVQMGEQLIIFEKQEETK
ncbi:3-methylcrotonyl-carboxylase subunit alpha [Stylonychia lemnae]|uniref:3-methylcrotonyl-carboxylase subunit alpha n=1 Tax=Stylonychia lemnae TaxID=5949 RepID=A0A078AYD8_STYLE|nr:3-methylcrotonyl-carboxylase subunit alpha [Stylonychia lemnae]|eukprot:CDW87420.1 3-methylcrotonyl-carboxylase subunit alpha [Stylonychia lemnae]